MRKRSNIFAVFSLLIISAPFVALTVLVCSQAIIRHEMEEKLEHAKLTTVELRTIQWVRVDEELIVNGKMFDVKEIKFSDGKYIITGLYDEDEHAIKKFMNDVTSKSGDSKTKLAFVKLFSGWYVQTNYNAPYIETISRSEFYIFSYYPYQNVWSDKPFQPPRIV
jgi:hypothetical protein